jgi:hypothetical protein
MQLRSQQAEKVRSTEDVQTALHVHHGGSHLLVLLLASDHWQWWDPTHGIPTCDERWDGCNPAKG